MHFNTWKGHNWAFFFNNKNISVCSVQQLKHPTLSAMWISVSNLPVISWGVPAQLERCPLLDHVYFSAFPGAVPAARSLQKTSEHFGAAHRALLLHFTRIWSGVFCSVLFLLSFLFLLGVLHHHLKLQIRFLRPFDNSEILLVSSCHKSFPYSCEIVLHCKNLWNQWHFSNCQCWRLEHFLIWLHYFTNNKILNGERRPFFFY